MDFHNYWKFKYKIINLNSKVKWVSFSGIDPKLSLLFIKVSDKDNDKEKSNKINLSINIELFYRDQKY